MYNFLKLNQFKLKINFKNSFSSKLFPLILCVFSLFAVNAQFYVAGTLHITSSVINSEPSFIVESTAAFTNYGTIENKSTTTVLGNTISGTGALKFSGSTAQTIDGNDRSIDCNVTINNSNNLSIGTVSVGTHGAAASRC